MKIYVAFLFVTLGELVASNVYSSTATLNVAAQLTVSGTVTDSQGMPLAGVTVLVKGTTNGTSTDFDGNYTLGVPGEQAVLVFSYIGFEAREVAVNGQSSIDVILQESMNELEEVVVVGFGTQKKENITGAVSTVDFGDVLGDRPVTNTSVALQGTAPGLQILNNSGEPGSEGVSINIRGTTSLNGGSPLILVDNVPVDVFDLNPRDIATVSVLKDAAASSIYGARAAFGVILITTKRPEKGKIKFSYSQTTSFSRPTELPKAASPLEFVTAQNDFGVDKFWAVGENTAIWKDLLEQYQQNPANFPDGYSVVDNIRYRLKGYDHAEALFGDLGILQIHNLNFGAANEKSAYRVSLGFSDENGAMVTDQDRFKKYNVNAYLKSELAKNLTGELTTYYSNYTNYTPKANYSNAIRYPSYVQSGTEVVNGIELPFDAPETILGYTTPNRAYNSNIRVFGKMNYNPIKGLNITGEYTFENKEREDVNIGESIESINATTLAVFPFNPLNTSYYNNRGKSTYKGANIYANYTTSIAEKHNLTLLAGYNYEQEDGSGLWVRKTNLISQDLPSISTATGDLTSDDSFYQWSTMGVFARMQYNYDNKYFIEVNGRNDGSSLFTAGRRFGMFPSVSTGWNVTKENFLKDNQTLSLLKLRASWGEVGNQTNSDYYPAILAMNTYNAPWINNLTGIRFITLADPGLISAGFTWETVRSLNFGFDLGLFQNRLNTTFDMYQRQTLDMIGPASELPAVIGATAPLANAADLLTEGWELNITWKDRIKDFRYEVGFNLYDSQAEITKFKNEGGLLNQYYVGRKIGEIWGYETDGFYTVDDFVDGSLNANLMGGTLKPGVPKFNGINPNPGDIKYKDQNDDGIIYSGTSTLDDPGDLKIIGNSQRRYTFGINASAGYKNWDLSVFMNGVGKRDVFYGSDLYWPMMTQFANVFKHQLDYWTPENTDAFFPRVYQNGGANYSNGRLTQTKYLEDGSYLNIKNISLGYTVPQEFIKSTGLQSLKLVFSGENMFMFDRMPSGLHPEFSDKGSGGSYPWMKKYSLGVTVNF